MITLPNIDYTRFFVYFFTQLVPSDFSKMVHINTSRAQRTTLGIQHCLSCLVSFLMQSRTTCPGMVSCTLRHTPGSLADGSWILLPMLLTSPQQHWDRRCTLFCLLCGSKDQTASSRACERSKLPPGATCPAPRVFISLFHS